MRRYIFDKIFITLRILIFVIIILDFYIVNSKI